MSSLESLPLRRFTTADGLEFHYVEQGDGAPLVFIHGGMGDWTSWSPQWPAFVGSFRCFSYSRRYSSPNSNPLRAGHHGPMNEALDLDALLDHWGVEKAHLVGTSYGAFIALQFAIARPHRVGAMVLTEPPLLDLADRRVGGAELRLAFETNVLEPAACAFDAEQIERAVRILTQGINGSGPGEASTPAGLDRRIRNARAMRAVLKSHGGYDIPDLDDLGQVSAATLLLRGQDTLPVHRCIFDALRDLMPAARSGVVVGAGHGVHRDNPAAFNALAVSFLKGIAAAE